MVILQIRYQMAYFEGEALKRAREELHYTREEFAKKCGWDEWHQSQLERPRRFYCGKELVQTLSKFFKIRKILPPLNST